MPRVPRINIEKALYYITARGDHSEEIFKERKDYTAYIELLKKFKDQYKFKLFSFCFLPNHLHLLLELAGDTTISQIMYGLNSNYTKHFNSAHERSGHLFQERYKMILVEKEPYLLDLTAYLHIHPKFLKLVTGISDYAYSSYPAYIYYDNKSVQDKDLAVPMGEEVKEVLDLLGGKKYSDFVASMDGAALEVLSKDLSRKTILGSDKFIDMVKSKVESEKMKLEEIAQSGAKSSRANKWFVVVGAVMIVALGALIIYLQTTTAGIKNDFKVQLENKDTELGRKIVMERQRVTEGLKERYRADMVSMGAMAKRLEIEKNKSLELENRLKDKEVKK
ncbi:MAG: transposase [Candidatus Omnitrophota bacterium]|jgi:REP element-mobilizing transposase RayT